MADLAVRPASYRDLKAVSENLVAEIIEGALETHPRPRPRHARAASRLLAELMNKFECGLDRAESWVFIKEPELHLERHVVVPDLAGWRAERLAAEPEDSFIDIAPDWVCEIITPSTARLDRGPKRRIYAEAGVRRSPLAFGALGRDAGSDAGSVRGFRPAMAASEHRPARGGSSRRSIRRRLLPAERSSFF
jgi:hypothetical protein